jgi:hypothetical protein
MADSPNTRLVLLCSPVSTRLSSPVSKISPRDPAEPQRADGPVGRDRVEQRPGQVGVVQRVVDLQPVNGTDPHVPSRAGSRARSR